MRDPLVSIKASDLKELLKSKGLKFTKTTWLEFLKECKSERVLNRTLVYTNATLAKKISKNLRVVSNSGEKFNRILQMTRIELGHKNVRNITKDDKQYESIKIAAGVADDFIKTFDIDDQDGAYKLFIEMAIELMGKRFSINKINYYKDKIYDEFEARLVIREDNNKEGTNLLLETYKKSILEASSFEFKLVKASDMMNFVYARLEADENKANYVDWTNAQFEGLAFLNAVPEPIQLYGLKALDRYNKYKRQTSSKNSIKNPVAKKAMDTSTKDYLKQLREKRLSK